jgi:hypothetical protein
MTQRKYFQIIAMLMEGKMLGYGGLNCFFNAYRLNQQLVRKEEGVVADRYYKVVSQYGGSIHSYY